MNLTEHERYALLMAHYMMNGACECAPEASDALMTVRAVLSALIGRNPSAATEVMAGFARLTAAKSTPATAAVPP